MPECSESSIVGAQAAVLLGVSEHPAKAITTDKRTPETTIFLCLVMSKC
jgi:hypothetical protein